MGYKLKGTWIESCSCKVMCRCNFGPAEPDQTWCSAVLGFEIESGECNGISLDGTKLVLQGELQGDFTGGIDKAKLYLDEGASQAQRDELEAIFQGQRGGVWEGISGMIGQFLPSQTVKIEVSGGDAPSIKVGDDIAFTLQPIKTEDGKQTVLMNSPIAAAFATDTQLLAVAEGSASDPDLRSWETLGYGAMVPFNWSF